MNIFERFCTLITLKSCVAHKFQMWDPICPDSFPATMENRNQSESFHYQRCLILSYLCLYIFDLKPYVFLIFHSDWHKLLWWYVSVWLVAQKTHPPPTASNTAGSGQISSNLHWCLARSHTA